MSLGHFNLSKVTAILLDVSRRYMYFLVVLPFLQELPFYLFERLPKLSLHITLSFALLWWAPGARHELLPMSFHWHELNFT